MQQVTFGLILEPVMLTDRCKDPPSIANAVYNMSRFYTIGHEITYRCVANPFTKSENHKLTCAILTKDEAPQWVGDKIECTLSFEIGESISLS